MTSAHGRVLEAKHGVQMQAGPAIVALCQIAQEAQDFALFVDLDRLILFRREIKPANLRFRKCTNRRNRCTGGP